MARTLGFNSTAGPVVVDQLGHSIGGGEWGPYDPLESMAVALLASGDLVDIPDLATGGAYDPDAAQGWAEVQAGRVNPPQLIETVLGDTPAVPADTPAASADSPTPARSRSTPKET